MGGADIGITFSCRT